MKYLIIAIIIVIPLKSIAQGYDLNIEIGTSISNFSGDVNATYSKYRAGLILGIGIESPIKDKSGMKFGILYEQKGQNFKGESTTQNGSESYDNNMTLNYLTVPVTFKKYLGKKTIAFSGGLYGAVLLVSTSNVNQTIINGGSRSKLVIKNGDSKVNFKSNDVGLILATSIQPFEKFYIDVKSGWGLLNIASDSNPRDEIKNHSIEILLGIML
ncbi:MAG: porin family protein [Marinoscillum sp.]